MTVPSQENQAPTETKNDKEYNFRMLEAKYERQLQQERAARVEAEKKAQEFAQKRNVVEEDDDDNEPYVDKKRLDKKLTSFERRMDEKIDKRAEEKARIMVEQERQQMWLKANPDFHEVMQHAQQFAERDPELAETILHMPEGFERQKLVFKTIKSMGLHKPATKEPSIQDKIDSNRRSPYYQPSSVGTAPYAAAGDFSPAGQKSAYDKLQQLKKNLRI
jgi:hypothetical protein